MRLAGIQQVPLPGGRTLLLATMTAAAELGAAKPGSKLSAAATAD